jgi:RNA polymerase sigma-70 factor (ECF subfamily)
MNENTCVLWETKNIEVIQRVQNIKLIKKDHSQKKEISVSKTRNQFLQLLQPVKKHLYNYIHKSLNFSEEADDIFQEALLKGFKYFYSFDRNRNFKTWIFTIANNLIKDHFRTKRALKILDQKEEIQIADNPVPPQILEIFYALRNLKPKQREVFVLYYYNEFKIKEISEITSLSKSNIKFILSQCRKILKKILEVSE